VSANNHSRASANQTLLVTGIGGLLFTAIVYGPGQGARDWAGWNGFLLIMLALLWVLWAAWGLLVVLTLISKVLGRDRPDPT